MSNAIRSIARLAKKEVCPNIVFGVATQEGPIATYAYKTKAQKNRKRIYAKNGAVKL